MTSSSADSIALDPQRVEALTVRELAALQARTPASEHQTRRAVAASMPLGVPTGVSSMTPYPITITKGRGAYLTDLDGNHYIDYSCGFGTTVFGHAHPAITQALHRQADRGTHFGALTEPVVELAEHLCGRYGLNWIRFSASGTEATMDALRIARARTGRTRVAKIEGGYHGSHPHALVSNNSIPLEPENGPDHQPAAVPVGLGITQDTLSETVVLPFNDLGAAERALKAGDIAGLIVEPILFNVGMIWPQDGYLEGLRRLCDEHGTLLIFDEVKSGATVSWGGAQELFGVTPHLKCLAKGIGGGLPVGAVGDTDGSCFDLIESWDVPHLGTLSGNPLTAAAGLAAMREVLTPDAFDGLHRFGVDLTRRINEVIEAYQLPAYATSVGAKGCIVWAGGGGPLRDFRDYQHRFDGDVGYLTWLYLMNRGVWLAPGQDEQWTHTVHHGAAEADQMLQIFEELARELRIASA